MIEIGDKLIYELRPNIPSPIIKGVVVDKYPNSIDTSYVISWVVESLDENKRSPRKITYDQSTMITLFSNGIVKMDLETMRDDKIDKIIGE